MNLRYTSLFLIAVIYIASGCGTEQQSVELEDHESITVTQWTDRTELYMEYDELVAGRETDFIIHLTDLRDFSPVTQGTLTFMFIGENGEQMEAVEEEPARPGIYLPTVIVYNPGTYTLELTIEGEQLTDTIAVGDVHVHEPSHNHHSHETVGAQSLVPLPDAIQFLKEQQWKIDFMVEPVETRTMTASVAAIGELREIPGRKAHVTVTVEGSVRQALDGSFPVPGIWVDKGTVLATLTPLPETRSHIAETLSTYLLAEAEYSRVQRLYEEKAVSRKRLEEARMNYEARKIKYEVIPWTIERGDAHNPGADITYQVTAPISGFLEKVDMNPGKTVNAGENLCTIFDPSRLLLIAHVTTTRMAHVGDLLDARFTVEGSDRTFTIADLNGRLLSRGNSVNMQTRTVPVVFEIDNPDNTLKVGMSADISLMTDRREEAIAVPASAVITEYNNYIAFVQAGGESFVKRILKTGITSDRYIQILDGLSPGERVVTVGAYHVRLASLSSVVPTGHGH